MNTDNLCSTFVDEVEQIEIAIAQARSSGLTNLLSWTQFVLDYCADHGLSWDAVIRNAEIVELLNILWLRTRTRRRR